MAIDKKWSGRTKVRSTARFPSLLPPQYGDIVSVTYLMLVGVIFVGVNRIFTYVFLELTVSNVQTELLWDVNMKTYMQYLT